MGVTFGSGHARLLTINDAKNDFDEASSEWSVGDPAHCFAVEEQHNRVVESATRAQNNNNNKIIVTVLKYFAGAVW